MAFATHRRFFLLFLMLLLTIPGFAQGRKTENVVLITLDGMRWQEVFSGIDSSLMNDQKYVDDADDLKRRFWAENPNDRKEKLLPFFWSTIAGKGQLYGNRSIGSLANLTNPYWFSYPGYNEILTGHADRRIDSNDKNNNPNTTVLEYLNRMDPFKGKVAAFGSWDVFPYIINESRSGIPVNAGFEASADRPLSDRELFLNELQEQIPSPWGSVRLDAFTHHFAVEYLKKHRPRLLYIAYGETDDFAHGGHYDAYIKSAHTTDTFIRNLWEWVQQDAGYRDKTTFVITTDHGRGTGDKWTSHGDEIDGADEIWIAVLGPDTPALGEIKSRSQVYTNQVAATVAAALGQTFPGDPLPGSPLPDALTNH